MRIFLVNGSPKPKRSVSENILNALKEMLPSDSEIVTIRYKDVDESIFESADTIVFAFPLYVDSLPAHLIKMLEQMETVDKNPDLKIYSIINNGFFESRQSRHAAKVMKHWCNHTDVEYSGCLCIGAGPTFGMSPMEAYPMKEIGESMDKLSQAITDKRSAGDIYSEPNLSKDGYAKSGNDGWIKAARKRGLTEENLYGKIH